MTAQVARRQSRRDVGSRGSVLCLLSGTPESRSAGGPRPAFCPSSKHGVGSAHLLSHHPGSIEIQAKSALSQDVTLTVCYQNSVRYVACDRGRVSARQPRYFLLLRQKISTQRKGDPTVRVPTLRFTSLRANLRHAIPSAVPPNSLRGYAAAPLRSDKRRQVRSRSNAVLRQRCSQPEQRAAGADTRVGADTGGLREF